VIIGAFIVVSFGIQVVSILQTDQEYHFIRCCMVSEDVREKMPPKIVGSLILLKHKLLFKNNTYPMAELGIKSDLKIDTNEYGRYRGFSLWYYHLGRYFNQPMFKYIPLLFMPFLLICLISLRRTAQILDEPQKGPI
jgi:hypothetical protein